MWLVTTFVVFVFVLVIFLMFRKKQEFEKFHLIWLVLMLLGTFIMVFVDHVIGFLLDGGSFFEIQTDSLVSNAVFLGFLMLVPIFLVWIGMVLFYWHKN